MFYRTFSTTMLFRVLTLASTTSLTLLGTSVSAQDIEKGKKLYQNCMACHGSEGHGNELLRAPAIAGLDAAYLETQLHNFKHGIRGGVAADESGLLMRPMTKLLVDEAAIKDVSAFIATLKPVVAEETLEGGDAAKGAAAYAVCLACHGMAGEGNAALKAPSLQYQNDWYMLVQLKKFKEGIRGTNPKDIGGMQMRPMSMTLADEQAMKDVIAYIRSISPKE